MGADLARPEFTIILLEGWLERILSFGIDAERGQSETLRQNRIADKVALSF